METLKTTGYAPVNGLQMYYEIYGDGDIPLVLIHGGGSTIESTFGVLLPLLYKHGKVIALELQAHGRTSDRDAPESFEQDAGDVAALLQYLKVEKANILGFSNGAAATMQIAIRHPKLVNKIVVIAGAYQKEGFVPGLFAGLEHANLSHLPKPLHTAFLAVTPDEKQLKNMFDKDVSRMLHFKDFPDEALPSIKAPALFISSDRDVILAEHTLKMSQLVPGARLIILPGPHGACIGAVEVPKIEGLPGITAALVENFLAE